MLRRADQAPEGALRVKKDAAYLGISLVLLAGYGWAGFSAPPQNPAALPIVFLQGSTPGTSQTGHVNISGTMIAGQFAGGGAGLTGVNADFIDGLDSTAFGMLSTTNAWSGVNTFSNGSNSFTGNGAGLTNVNAQLLDGLDSTAFLTGVPVPLNLVGATGVGGIIHGTNTQNSSLAAAVRGTSQASTALTYAGYFDNLSTGGVAVSGQTAGPRGVEGISSMSSGLAYGGYFESSSTSGLGVYGRALTTSGANAGGMFESQSTSGSGVIGNANAVSGTTKGGSFTSASTSGVGAVGLASASTGTNYGLQGLSNSTTGTGVLGQAPQFGMRGSATGGGGFGVEGSAFTSFGTGVAGVTNTSTGVGVRGENANITTGIGVYGLAGTKLSGTVSNKIGVMGEANEAGSWAVFGFSSNDGIGVRGQSSGTGGVALNGVGISGAWAGVFQGDVKMSARLMKTYGGVDANVIPIAFGTVNSAGLKLDGTNNWSVVWNAVNSSYDITITGVSYTSRYTTIVTPIASSSPRIGGVAPSGTDLAVTFFTTANAKVQVSFHFMVYDPQ